MIIRSTKGKTRSAAVRLGKYLVLPKEGDPHYQPGERLAGPPQMEGFCALLPSQFDAESARQFAEQIADQLVSWAKRFRPGKPMPKNLFQHVSLSFHPDDRDKITGELADQITDDIVNEVMPGPRQKLKVGHADTPNHVHRHRLIGTVDQEGRVWNPREDYRLWELACEKAEIKYGLHRVAFRKACATEEPERMPQEKVVSGKELQGIIRTGQLTGKAHVQQALRECLAGEVTFPEFVANLEARGIEILPNVASTGHVSGVSFRYGGSTYRGSALGKSYAWKAIAKRTRFDAIRDTETIERLKKKDQQRRENPASISMVEAAEPTPKKYRRTLDLAFELVGDAYLWRTSKRTAFIDCDTRIEMQSASGTAIKAALQLAVGKGWSVIQLTGDEDFRRRAWALAEEMGIQTVGYDAPPVGTGDGASPGDAEKGQNYGHEPDPEQNRTATRNRQSGGDPGDEYAAENAPER